MEKTPDSLKSRPQLSNFYSTLSVPEHSYQFKSLIGKWLNYGLKVDGLARDTLYGYSDAAGRFLWWWAIHTKSGEEAGGHPRHVTPYHLQEFFSYLREPADTRWGEPVQHGKRELSVHTISWYGRSLRPFFSWLEKQGQIEKSPFDHTVKFRPRKADRTVKVVKTDQLAKLFTFLCSKNRLSTFTGVRDLAMISLLLDSGVRRGELLSLHLDDLDLTGLRCRVTGKTGPRLAYFGQVTKGYLWDYLKLRNESDTPDWLWLTRDGEPLGEHTFADIIRHVAKQSGVSFHAHKLRHTFGTLLASKVSAFELKDLMGHSDLKTTLIYVNLNPDRLSQVHNEHSPLTALQSELGLHRKPGRPRKYR